MRDAVTGPGDRWEMGSLFHAAPVPPGPAVGAPWEDRPHALVGTGRDALRLVFGQHRPRRVWVPSYLCQEVVSAVAASVPEVRAYPDGPLDPADVPEVWDGVRPGDALLTVAYFGVRPPKRVPGTVGDGVSRDEVLVVEDHTHGPCGAWARASEADACIASLRKLWPLPDGGVLWSPVGGAVPDAPPCLPELERASGIKLAGMELKARYLRGEAVEKPLFRSLLDRGESTLHGAEASGITSWSRAVLEALPFAALEEARGARFGELRARLPEREGYRVLAPAGGPGALPAADPAGPGDADAAPAPFSALVVFDEAEARDRVHRALVEGRVYASRLWPLEAPVLDGVREEDVALARRSFSLPLDMRYDHEDMQRASEVLADALGRVL